MNINSPTSNGSVQLNSNPSHSTDKLKADSKTPAPANSEKSQQNLQLLKDSLATSSAGGSTAGDSMGGKLSKDRGDATALSSGLALNAEKQASSQIGARASNASNQDVSAGALPANSAISDLVGKYPDSQVKTLGDGRFAVLQKDGPNRSLGVFNADGSKAAPPGDGLQKIDPSQNGGKGSILMAKDGTSINFDLNGLTVDPGVKNKGTPLAVGGDGSIAKMSEDTFKALPNHIVG